MGMACATCHAPIVSFDELLTEDVPRLESKVYPYQLDFLNVEDAWVYSATNKSDDRFDVARFGGDARFRVRAHPPAIVSPAPSLRPRRLLTPF